MNTSLRSTGRLLGRLLLPVGLLVGLGLLTSRWAAPARAATPMTVSTCDEPHLDAAISQASSDNADDPIAFKCSGDIQLTSSLIITGSMTLDGSGQSVTLDGHQGPVLTVQASQPGRCSARAKRLYVSFPGGEEWAGKPATR